MTATMRYSRQIALPEIGEEGQQKLGKATVLIVGLGGLGCPVALFLAGAGVGRLGLADPDVVAISNLHRQLLYSAEQVGERKVEAAAARLAGLNPSLRVDVHPEGLTANNAGRLIAGYDLIMDCTDNFATRYLLDSACAAAGKSWVHGSVSGFGGVVSVFGGGVSYADVFPECEGRADTGIIGPTAGTVGAIQAAEAIKLLCGVEPTLRGRLLTVDLLNNSFNTFDL